EETCSLAEELDVDWRRFGSRTPGTARAVPRSKGGWHDAQVRRVLAPVGAFRVGGGRGASRERAPPVGRLRFERQLQDAAAGTRRSGKPQPGPAERGECRQAEEREPGAGEGRSGLREGRHGRAPGAARATAEDPRLAIGAARGG